MAPKKTLLCIFYVHIIIAICFTLFITAEKCHPDDKKALLAINKGINVTFPTWNPATDCCHQWSGVRCDPNTHRVTTLYILQIDDFTTTVPTSVGDLPYLTFLYIHKCPNLTGTIPRSITRLKRLRLLWITNNGLTGPIPDFLDQLPELVQLDLSFNNLTGPIPPSLARIPKLTILSLDRNYLTGPIPGSFGRFKGKIFTLVLTKNQLTGPIPKSLAFVDFQGIYLGRNNFTGDASFLFGNNTGSPLEVIDLSRNQFEFNLTNVVLPTGLINIDLSHNLIYGSLPQGLAQQPALYQFNVSYNRLCGEIPVGQQLSKYDQYSLFHNKCLCGSPLPSCK